MNAGRLPKRSRPAPGILAGLALTLLAACAGSDAGGEHLTVFAAASLRDALTELAETYRERTGVEAVLNLGSSGRLAVQIERGGHADVFVSAGADEMDRLAAAGMLDADTRTELLSNQLVVVVPAGGRKITGAAELAGTWPARLSIANPGSVPAGRYAKAWLEAAGLWDQVEGRVLPGIDVRAALAAVEYGGADAGIVYRTDAAMSDKVAVAFAVPLEEGPRIVYPAAIPADCARATEARRFLEFLAEPASAAVFERYGFVIARSQ